jgi:TRAP-type C4-dicarboxylate transport system substrate-binding protein
MPEMTFLRRWSATLLIAALPLVSGSASAETYELKVSHFLPPNHTINKEMQRWADELKQKSGGRLVLSVFPAGQMGPLPRQYDLARTGVADIAFFLHGATPGRFKLTEVAQLPFTFWKGNTPVSNAQGSFEVTSAAGDLTKEHQGVHILYVLALTTGGLYFSKATVHAPADLKGLRIRHNGPIASAALSAWGATPVAVLPAEVSDAMQKGTIDGVTFNYEVSESYQMANVVKTVTEISPAAATFALVMNGDKYEKLPADLKKLIDDTTGPAAARRVGALYDAAEAHGKEYMLKGGVTVTSVSPEGFAQFKKMVDPVTGDWIKKLEGEGVPAKKFHDRLVDMTAKAAQ